MENKRLELIEAFKVMSYMEQTAVLSVAIDYMQQWNGRTKMDCICLATRDMLKLDYNDHQCYREVE